MDPTPEQWLASHDAFRRYCEVNPRERLANEDVLAANDPLGHFKGYCVTWGTGVWPTVWEFTREPRPPELSDHHDVGG